jgi:hypothetical protein
VSCGASGAALAAALDAAAGEAPESAARARLALDRVLAPLATSAWPEVAWRFSRLCPGGYPIELVWRPGRPGVFWTAEAAAPELPEAGRLERAAALLPAIAGLPADDRDIARLAALQAGARLLWGAWIGGRHEAAGDSAKLYAEVPAGRMAALGAAFPAAAAWIATLPAGALPRLVGLEPSRRRWEVYARIPAHEPGGLFAPLKAAGAAGNAIPGLLGELAGGDPEAALEGKGIGLSLALEAEGRLAGIAVIVVARRLAGTEDRLKKRLAPFLAGPGAALGRHWAAGGATATLLSVTGAADGSGRWHLGLRANLPA